MRSTTVYEIAFAHPAEVVIGTNFALVTLSHQRVSETTVALDAAMNLAILVIVVGVAWRSRDTDSADGANKAFYGWLGRPMTSDAFLVF